MAELPAKDQKEEAFDFPDEGVLWVEKDMSTMYFDGASNKKGFEVGIPLVYSEGVHTLILVKLDFELISNMTKYEASIIIL